MNKKRFIIGINKISEDQGKKIVAYMKANSLGWWHWLDNFWLVIDVKNQFTAKKIRDDLMVITPGINMLVIEITGTSDSYIWSGLGPNKEDNNMFEWLNKQWDVD